MSTVVLVVRDKHTFLCQSLRCAVFGGAGRILTEFLDFFRGLFVPIALIQNNWIGVIVDNSGDG